LAPERSATVVHPSKYMNGALMEVDDVDSNDPPKGEGGSWDRVRSQIRP